MKNLPTMLGEVGVALFVLLRACRPPATGNGGGSAVLSRLTGCAQALSRHHGLQAGLRTRYETRARPRPSTRSLRPPPAHARLRAAAHAHP